MQSFEDHDGEDTEVVGEEIEIEDGELELKCEQAQMTE